MWSLKEVGVSGRQRGSICHCGVEIALPLTSPAWRTSCSRHLKLAVTRRRSASPSSGRRASGPRYERTFTIRYALELGLATRDPRKKARKRQRPSAGGLHENRATPSALV
jgi:hypothetical protein